MFYKHWEPVWTSGIVVFELFGPRRRSYDRDDSFCHILGGKWRGRCSVNVMRFDDSVLRMLGSELEALTVEQDLLLSASSYFNRSTASSRLPGALLKNFEFTL